MKEEKGIVLQLLEDGKINKEEAMKLYEGLNRAEEQPTNSAIGKGFKKISNAFGKATETVSDKYKEVEPAIKEKSKEVYNKAQDKVSDVYSKIDEKKQKAEDIIDHDDFVGNSDTDESHDDIVNDENEK